MPTPKQSRPGGSSLRPWSGAFVEFVESSDGLVHLTTRGEYTLCGDALEGDGYSPDDSNYIPESHQTTKRTVTCPRCSEVVMMCRGVRCRPNDKDLARRALDSE